MSSSIRKNNELKGKDKVLSICNILGATEYYNAIGGMSLYSEREFKEHSILLSFLKSRDIRYKQFNNDFIPCLSIIDVMMFNSVDSIRNMLTDYDLISRETRETDEITTY
jgi:hypothetical protein